MIIQKPKTATRKNQYETDLYFERGREAFYLRGAIAWPDIDMEGVALFAGQRIKDKVIFIFGQYKFWTTSPWVMPGGELKRREDGSFEAGLIQFILDTEALYKGCSFFHGGQHIDIVKRHANDLYRNPLLSRNFELIEVPYVNEVGDTLIIEKAQCDGFVGQAGSMLSESTIQWAKLRATGAKGDNAVHALRILLCGFEHQPYVKINIDKSNGLV